MNLTDITLMGVFGAGLLSFLSPCVLPLLPAYLTYMAGLSIDEINDKSTNSGIKSKIIAKAFAFVLGFSCVFISLGATASAIGAVIRQYQNSLAILAGIVIIVMGLHFLGFAKISLLNRQWQLPIRNKNHGFFSPFIMGLAFAFGWTPCIGPVLGAVLSIAASQDTLAKGAGLLTIYSAGLSLPFILTAFFTKPIISFFAKIKRHLYIIEKIIGLFLIFTGVMFLTGGMQYFAYFLLETFPFFTNIG